MSYLIRSCTIFLILSLALTGCKKEQPDKFVKNLISYEVVASQSFVLPVSDAMGVTSDQTNIWILSGGYNDFQHELTCFNPANQTVVNQFVFDSLIEVLGTGAYGLTWDGNSIWISVSGQNNKLVQVDPQNGAILQSFGNPGFLGPSDLSWDGSKLWMVSGTGEIHTINPTDGSAQLFFNRYDRDQGIAVRGSQIWVGDLFDGDIHIYNAADAELIGYLPGARDVVGNFCFHNGQLAVVSAGSLQLYDIIE